MKSMLPMLVLVVLITSAGSARAQTRGLQADDLLKLRSVSTVRFSPDDKLIAYLVSSNSGAGRPYSQLWVLNVGDGKSTRIGGNDNRAGEPEWSPDGRWIAYLGERGLTITHPDGSEMKVLAPLQWTNGPLPSTGKRIAWSPDSKQIAFTSSVPGPETQLATGDPIVITRYLYKPDASEGLSHFNDNRRTHVFVTDLAGMVPRQLTSGNHYEHSIDWSPDGQEILFVSNREDNEDQFFNYDVFALKVADGSTRRLTATENAEYYPTWSPDGKTIVYLATKRGLTDLETTMEDTHVWLMNADGGNRREVGGVIDNRQGVPQWSPDGSNIYFTVQERGNVHLFRLPAAGGPPQRVIGESGTVGSFSIGKDNSIAYSFSSPSDLAELYIAADKGPAKKQTDLNTAVLQAKQIAPVESFTFISNDNQYQVEAFLTKPLGMTAESKHPLIVNIHGGPHGQQGPAFNFKNQAYAALGWATLMVNYRGSTGYGQVFTDAVFGDQNGNEAQDVLYGLSAAMRRYLWIDRDRLGIEGTSYGGQLTGWLITQTGMFKAAIPTAGIYNIISYNYMTYYNQYEQMEWGAFPHQGNLMDVLWERSALKHVANVRTPTMIMHGENDSDVPTAEAEQFYVALKDVGVETVMVRYPREGHGLNEPRHVVDGINRSVAWYRKHFPPEGAASPLVKGTE